MARGADHAEPPFVDSVNSTCGASIVPLTYAITRRLLAPAPVGAPLAMSTEGAGARSLLAPATPSITGRPGLVARPGGTAVVRDGHQQGSGRRVRRLLLSAEGRPAHVHVPEERAGLGVVRPDLLLVRERGGRLLGHDHGRRPRALVVRGRSLR